MGVVFAREQDLPVDDYINVVASTYMRDKRPIGDRDRVARLLRGANLIVTARDQDGSILGFARGTSDGAWTCYLADVVVLDRAQGRGIGKGILDECARVLGSEVAIALISYPEAEPFYRRIGMEPAQAFVRWRTK